MALIVRAAALALALFTLVPGGLAQTIRVATWNMEPPSGVRKQGTNAVASGARLKGVGSALSRVDPDVILLQHVSDYRLAQQLARSFKGSVYRVIIYSEFRDARTGELSEQQVAILAKAKAESSWTESWQSQGGATTPGGFAFASIQFGKRRVGFLTAEAGDPAAASDTTNQTAPAAQPPQPYLGQLADKVASAPDWLRGQVNLFVVGVTFNPRASDWQGVRDANLKPFTKAGFDDAFHAVAGAERLTVPQASRQPAALADYLFTQPGGRSGKPRILPVQGNKHYPAVCEIRLDPPPASATPAISTQAVSLPEPPTVKPAAPPATAEIQPAKPEAQLTQPALPVIKPEPQPAPPGPQTAKAEPAPTQPQIQPTIPPAPVAAVYQPATPSPQLVWMVAALVAVVGLGVFVWLLAKLRQPLDPAAPALLTDGGDMPSSYTVVASTRSATEGASAHHAPPPAPHPIIHLETPGATQAEALRKRAVDAEQRAERANAAIRSGVIPHLRQWLKQTLVRKLVVDRTQLLETQEEATHKAAVVEGRLARIERQIQRQNEAYQTRIDELTRELMAAKEESRELIRARIAQVKAEMAAARARLMGQSEADGDSRP